MQPDISSQNTNHIHRLFIDSPQGTEIVLIDEISYIESNFGLTIIHLINDKRFTVYKSLESVSKQINDSRFIQISRNIILNKIFAYKISIHPISKNIYIEMSQPIGIELRCTRYNLKRLKDVLQY